MTEEGRAIKRKQRNYTLLFETNGTFRVDNVEPGEYQLYISLTNPDRPDNYYEHIGSVNRNVTIPAAKAGEGNDPIRRRADGGAGAGHSTHGSQGAERSR
jgi:hypothetical protein